MKPQQRTFIVEVKSARRRSTIRPSSIWGDTDLKALVREAETEAPHLFELAERHSELCPAQSAVVCLTDGTTTDDAAQISDPQPLADQVSGIQDAAGSASISQLEEKRPKAKSPKVPRRQRRARGIRHAGSRKSTVATEIHPDELQALEQENRRLKEMLVQRLQRENIQLRKMLERFVSN